MQDKNAKIFVYLVIILILVVALIAWFRTNGPKKVVEPGKYDTFATCLKDKGAVFYGAFWCPHCQEQKKLFGSSAKLLNYVECSTADGQSQLPMCTEKGIKGYPTWRLADGTDIPNENSAGVTLETLAQKTSCELPK